MKKTKALTVLSVCVLLACAAVFLLTAGDRPFKDLDAAEIASADVHLIPPDKNGPDHRYRGAGRVSQGHCHLPRGLILHRI